MEQAAISLLCLGVGVFAFTNVTARTISYVQATFEHTSAVTPGLPGTESNGNTSAWPPGTISYTATNSDTDNLWELRAFGSDYYAHAASTENPRPLRTRMTGLTPGQCYRTYVFFLILDEDVNGQTNCWIQAGLTMDALRTFFGDYACRFRESGFSWTGALPADLTNASTCAVFVGTARASEAGEISVYIQNQTNSLTRHTDYLGVGYEEVPYTDPPYPTTLTLHVAPQGTDEGSGTEQQPLLSLHGARDRLRQVRNGTFEPAIVWVHGGTYRQEETLAFDERDSWAIYRAVSNEIVRVIGGIEYVTNLTPVTDALVLARLLAPEATNHLYQVDLPSAGVTNYGEIRPRGFEWPTLPQQVEVYLNGHRLFMAQYPNPGQKGIPIGQVLDAGSWTNNLGGRFMFSSNRVTLWAGNSHVCVKGYFANGWADDLVPVAEIDPVAMTMQTSAPLWYGFQAWSPYNDYLRFFGVNLLEEIDLPGESWLDRSSGRLYLYPPVGTAPTAVRVSVTKLEGPLVSISNACHVVFDGTDLGLSRGVGLQIYGGDHCGIRNADISQLGNQAVMIETGPVQIGNQVLTSPSGHDHYVASCRIHDCGSGGIGLGGGLTTKYISGRNRVENCEIYDVNRHEQNNRSAVNFSGIGHLLRNSLIHNIPQIGILASGCRQRIEYNEFSRIYYNTWITSGAVHQGRTPIGWNEICNNLFYHVAIESPYSFNSLALILEDGYYGARVQRNVFVRSGKRQAVSINGGSMNQCSDNIFVDCQSTFAMNCLTSQATSWIEPGGLFDQFLNTVNYQNPPWSLRRPELVTFWDQTPATPYNTLARNLCVRSGVFSITNDWWTGTPDTRLDTPGFSQGLRLLSGSAAHQQIPEFNPGDISEMGVFLSLHELRMRDWNTALRRAGYLFEEELDLTRGQLLERMSSPIQGGQLMRSILFPGNDPDGLSATPSGFALRLIRVDGNTNRLCVRVNSDAAPLVGMRLEESENLQDWQASGLLLRKQWSANLDGFETYEVSTVEVQEQPCRFYRVVFNPAW